MTNNRLKKIISMFQAKDGSKVPFDIHRFENVSFQPKLGVNDSFDFNIWIKSSTNTPDRKTYKLKNLTLEKCILIKQLIDEELIHADDLFNMDVEVNEEVSEPVEEELIETNKNSEEIIPEETKNSRDGHWS